MIIYKTITEAAAHAGVRRNTIYRWVQKGTHLPGGGWTYLTANIIAGEYYIEQDELDNFLDALGYEFEEEEPDESDQDESDEE